MNVTRGGGARLALVVAVLALGTAQTPAASGDVDAKTVKTLTETLQSRFSDVVVHGVYPSPLPGLYEVLTDKELIYTNDRASLVLVGSIIDTQTHENLSGKRWNQLNSVDFSTLPLDRAIKVVRGNGTRILAVFADPLCPYCKELENALEELSDSTVYVFLYPLEGIHPGASAQAHKIWCASDRSVAWSEWMLHQTQPSAEPAQCDASTLQEVQHLGERLLVNSTPTLFLHNGQRLRGMPPKDRLPGILDSSR